MYNIKIVIHTCSHTAIVGGGIGGTSAALFLDELFGGSALVDLYEEGRVGGRLAALDISGHWYEVGGSILHPDNQYMDQFVSDLGRCVSSDCFYYRKNYFLINYNTLNIQFNGLQI